MHASWYVISSLIQFFIITNLHWLLGSKKDKNNNAQKIQIPKDDKPKRNLAHHREFWNLRNFKGFEGILKNSNLEVHMLANLETCYRVLQSVTECYRMLQNAAECYRMSQIFLLLVL